MHASSFRLATGGAKAPAVRTLKMFSLPLSCLCPPRVMTEYTMSFCCLFYPTDCSWLPLLHAVWGSVALTGCQTQGMLFDPSDLRPRLHTAALSHTLQLLANLSAAAAPDDQWGPGGAGNSSSTSGSGSGVECWSGMASEGFAAGTCAIALATFHQLQVLDGAIREGWAFSSGNSSSSSTGYSGGGDGGAFGSASGGGGPSAVPVAVFPVPGSEVVWDNVTDTLVQCDEGSCPVGEERGSREGSGGGQGLRLNRSPHLTASSLTGVINAR